MINLEQEITLQTTRSGGKGGQHVNKVETAVVASFPVHLSTLLNEEQKKTVLEKLANRINKEGCLVIKAQTFRTQLENKTEAIRKVNELIEKALQKKKMRFATKPTRGAKEKRLDSKKKQGERKQQRKKFDPRQF